MAYRLIRARLSMHLPWRLTGVDAGLRHGHKGIAAGISCYMLATKVCRRTTFWNSSSGLIGIQNSDAFNQNGYCTKLADISASLAGRLRDGDKGSIYKA